MKYVYAALLLHAMGKEVNEENLAKVIQAAGEEPDMVRVKALAAALSEIDVEEILKSAAIASPAAVAVPTEAPAPKLEEEKKEEGEEEEEKEEKEEEAFEGLASLFG